MLKYLRAHSRQAKGEKIKEPCERDQKKKISNIKNKFSLSFSLLVDVNVP